MPIRSRLLEQMATRAPSVAIALAQAKPKPRLAAVTSATLSPSPNSTSRSPEPLFQPRELPVLNRSKPRRLQHIAVSIEIDQTRGTMEISDRMQARPEPVNISSSRELGSFSQNPQRVVSVIGDESWLLSELAHVRLLESSDDR